ncbi:hypothetical protein D3C80_1837050 [compost metagenome]
MSVKNTFGESGVYSLKGYTKAQLVYSNVNTNVLYPRTSLPSLLADMDPGSHLLISAVCGAPAGSRAVPPLEEALDSLGISLTAQGVTISREGLTDVTVDL